MHPVLVPSIISLVAGVAILIWPRILNFIVAAYLIIIGAVGLAMSFSVQ